MNTSTDTATRAAALFVSYVSIFDQLTDAQVRTAIDEALGSHGGSQGCTAEVAQAYGDHPELAAPRMRWARRVVEQVYAPALALAA
jgi:hypothetical protein